LSLRYLRPWILRDFERRLDAALIHYAYVRPHSALGAQVPIEVYYGIRGHLPRPATPPRGRADEPSPEIPFDVAFLDPENRGLPVLVPRAA